MDVVGCRARVKIASLAVLSWRWNFRPRPTTKKSQQKAKQFVLQKKKKEKKKQDHHQRHRSKKEERRKMANLFYEEENANKNPSFELARQTFAYSIGNHDQKDTILKEIEANGLLILSFSSFLRLEEKKKKKSVDSDDDVDVLDTDVLCFVSLCLKTWLRITCRCARSLAGRRTKSFTTR